MLPELLMFQVFSRKILKKQNLVVCLLTAMVPNEFLVLVFVLLLTLRVSSSWLL